MLIAALALFALAALLGLTLATLHFQSKKRPGSLALGHGTLAATGLVLLIIAAVTGSPAPLTWPLVLFIVAALGGFYLLSFRLRSPDEERLPSAVVVIHGLIAVTAFVWLLTLVV